MFSVNRWSLVINHVAQSREQSCGTLEKYSIDLFQSSGLQVTKGDMQKSGKKTLQEYNVEVSW